MNPEDIPKRWPLAAPLETRNTSLYPISGATLLNGYAEYSQAVEGYQVYKRPGIKTTARHVTTGTIAQGIFSDATAGWTFPIFSVASNKVFQGAVQLGTMVPISGATNPGFFELFASTPRVLVVGNCRNAYTYNYNTLVFSQITDANFVAIGNFCPGFVSLDDTLYVMDVKGNIFGSALDDATSWDPLNVIKANSNPDIGVALARQLQYVIAFKQYSTQIFYDAGNATGSPLKPVPDAQLPVGCLSSYSVARIDNTLLWLTSNESGAVQVIQMDSLTPATVSTPDVERLLSGITLLSVTGAVQTGAIGMGFKHRGHRFYVLTVTSLNITLVYDLDQKLWYVWTDANGNRWQVQGIAAVPPQGGVQAKHVVQIGGNIYDIDSMNIYPTDLGLVIPVDIYTSNFDAGVNRRKTLNRIYFDADQQAGSILSVRWSDDDYQNWSNFRTVDLGTVRPSLINNGTFKRRAYHFRCATPTPFRIKAADLQMDLGSL